MGGVKPQSGSWGPFPIPQNTKVYGTVNARFAGGGMFDGLGNRGFGFGTNKDQTIKENFTMYSRPSAFGPPVLAITASQGEDAEGWHEGFPASGSDFEFGAENAIYSSHTPPYYDGESWVDIVFYPKGLQAVSGSGDFDNDLGADDVPHLFANMVGDAAVESYVPTVAEISSLVSDEVLKSGADAVPVGGSFIRYWRFDQEELRRTDDAISSYHKGDTNRSRGYGPQSGPWVNRWAMQGDASLNLFEKDAESRWIIQSKFETPMLNFNHVTASDGTLTKRTDTDANITIPKGMWHQFGRLPQEEQGVFMEVTDIPADWLTNHPSASLIPDIAGTISGDNRSERIPKNMSNGDTTAKSYYNKYSLPVDGGLGKFTLPSMGSLIDVCGFTTDSKKIGTIKDKKTISEAIVAVPFVTSAGERKFFSLKSVSSDELVAPSVAAQIEKMQTYILPPQLDFVRNDVPRVAMYIFEFKQELDRNDLSHIWQNLPPKIGVKAEETYATISHELFTNELMGDWKSVDDLAEETVERSGFESEVKWMVFKVKQRAKTDYFAQIGGGGGVNFNKVANLQKYSYNWPYDFCSIGGVDTSSLDDGPSGAFGDSGVILDTGTLSDDTPPDDDGPSGGPTGGLGGPFGPGVLGTNQLELEGDGTNTGYTTTKGAFDNGGTDFSSPDTSNPAFEADD